MKILFVIPRLPFPVDTGAKIRTLNLLKKAANDNEVSLLSFDFESRSRTGLNLSYSFSQDVIEELKKSGIEAYLVKANDKFNPSKILSRLPISIEKYRSRAMEDKLKEILRNEKFDLVHFDHLHMGQYQDCVNGIPCVLDEHNIESVILERCARIEKNWVKRRLFSSQAKKMARLESGLVSRFSRCVVVSNKDRENLLKLSEGQAKVEVIPNGVDTEYFSSSAHPLMSSLQKDALVFTGSMDWLPNADAVVYFCKEVLPLIWKENEAVKFYVVGKNPSGEIQKLAKEDSRIVVIGAVDDVRPYMAEAKIFVVPMRVGGGTRLKILEAMAMEKVVVSTTIGAEGISYTQDKNIILKDTPRNFTQAVLMLLDDETTRKSLGKAARELVLNSYDWKIIGNKLTNLYREISNEK